MRILTSLLFVVACSKSSPPTTSTTPTPTTETPAATPSERPTLTAAACAEQGGEVVGDIGDGAIHRPEYRCASNGEAPIGTIVNDASGPAAIEGSVCCKKK